MKAIIRNLQSVVFFIITFIFMAHGFAQERKKKISGDDYYLWSSLAPVGISTHGTYFSYFKEYDAQADTLFIQDSKGWKVAIPNTKYGDFLGENYFLTLNAGTLKIMDLKSKSIREVPKVIDYMNIDGVHYMSAAEETDGICTLSIEDLKEGKNLIFEHAVNWKIIGKQSNIVCVVKDNGAYTMFRGSCIAVSSKEPLFSLNDEMHILDASDKGILYYILNGNDIGISFYNFKKHRNIVLPKNSLGIDPSAGPVGYLSHISQAGNKVILALKNKPSGTASPLVEIWNTKAKILWNSHYDKTVNPSIDYYIWDLEQNQLDSFLNETEEVSLFDSQYRYAILSSVSDSIPGISLYPNRDYCVYDFARKEKHPLLQNYSGIPSAFIPAAKGDLIYYKDENGSCVYNFVTKKNTSISNMQSPTEIKFASWLDNGSQFLLYDQYDIWLTDAGGKAKRLTDGRENNMIYRLAGHDERQAVSLSPKLLLTAESGDRTSSGYVSLDKGKISSIIYEHKKINQLLKAPTGELLVMAQGFDDPPSLHIIKGKKSIRVVSSNDHHHNFQWGKSERLTYTSRKGKKLQGIICYPPDMDTNRKYPMVVRIYEKQGSLLNQYTNPGYYNNAGFNVTNLLNKGYIVFFPDIEYDTGEPGESALECVMAGVEYVVLMGKVDREKIALMGYSFGGYETNYIITHTDYFVTAIAGAAVSDLVSKYLSISENHKLPEFWRFEKDQMRLKKSLFEDWENYIENSPIYEARKVKTPLLSFTGGADTQVNPKQSFEFWLAMLRLGKPNVLLVYPQENHSFMVPESQKDLTIKTEQWLGHFLQGLPLPEWAVPL